jgi:CTP synthase (UTP-ammonia lyase)
MFPAQSAKADDRNPMKQSVRIALLGDFDPEARSHWATEAALFHAASWLGFDAEPRWFPTEILEGHDAQDRLAHFDGVWAVPGSPYRSFNGMLRGIEFARRRDLPYLGTCGGFQYALIEFSRNVLGLSDADTAENNSNSTNIVITPVACPLPERKPGGPKMDGDAAVRPIKGTLVHELCRTDALQRHYFCNFETNPEYVPRWEAAGLRVAARGPQNEMRAFDLPGQRFFLATLFQPQLSSRPEQPDPIVLGYLRACAEFRASKKAALARSV